MLKKHATSAILGAQTPKGDEVSFQKESARANFDHHIPEKGYIHVRSRMISSRCNDNFDEFPAEEIRKAYKTFIGKPVFVNHHNADHRRARGVIVDAVLHEHQNPDGTPDVWVEGLMAVDALTYPKLAEAILKGDINKTSMGTDVKFSKCSACGNIAESPSDYCSHIPKMKGKKYFRTTASGQKVGEVIREICYGLHFFENSLLVEEPADPTALFLGVDARGIGKAASKDNRFDGCSLKQDDDGWYIHTHRARSDSYPSPEEIPAKDIAFIRSTGSVPQKDTSPHEKIPVVRDVMDADRFHGVSLREDDTGYFVRTPHGRSDSYTSPDEIPDEAISQVRSLHHSSLMKGAPFAGYDSFEACVKANQDKDDPEAYCGSIKHKVEGQAKTAVPREDGSTMPPQRDLPRKDQIVSPPSVDSLRDENCPVCGNSDFFSGDRCQVCGFILPPQEFNDPDLTKHRDMKLVDPSSVREDGQVADVTDEGAIREGEDALASPDELDENGEFDSESDMLECPNCGFQIKGAEPTTENTEEEPATLRANDLCPNCEEDELLPAEDLEEDLEYEEDDFGETDEEAEEVNPDEEESDDNSEDESDPDEDEDPVDDGDDEQKRRNENVRK